MSLSRRMKKERGYFATKERYSEKTKTTLDTHHTCMGLNIIKLSKRSQIQRGTYCMFLSYTSSDSAKPVYGRELRTAAACGEGPGGLTGMGLRKHGLRKHVGCWGLGRCSVS